MTASAVTRLTWFALVRDECNGAGSAEKSAPGPCQSQEFSSSSIIFKSLLTPQRPPLLLQQVLDCIQETLMSVDIVVGSDVTQDKLRFKVSSKLCNSYTRFYLKGRHPFKVMTRDDASH
ncbi:hypothetical protein PCANC_18582 [Puccinia coronata f. sp. avenae]|uniref:Uncharacterized protein n=1 Tax=Puccinia coronata f. sp. avenae TaxID=200324 RepID=A0A2N5RWR7_9BASI|nr:hypothetical protein PCANC_25126 [Puccinia coronata f. sp. avenae]PLW26688.1 hypothetical protein PCANC_18582 [Puccinia coronata f. sp. avenae]